LIGALKKNRHEEAARKKFTPVKVKIYSLWGSNNLWGKNYPIG
jgi:hypothetical protein